ncbi:hypothetical protein JFM43_004446 [Salmonella enterica]|nr:hypothetical protein [Salmonella enterica]
MQKAEREAAIAANKEPISPEQMLILCAEWEGMEKKILDNRGIRTQTEILAIFRGYRKSKEKNAWRQINMRNWRNEKY